MFYVTSQAPHVMSIVSGACKTHCMVCLTNKIPQAWPLITDMKHNKNWQSPLVGQCKLLCYEHFLRYHMHNYYYKCMYNVDMHII